MHAWSMVYLRTVLLRFIALHFTVLHFNFSTVLCCQKCKEVLGQTLNWYQFTQIYLTHMIAFGFSVRLMDPVPFCMNLFLSMADKIKLQELLGFLFIYIDLKYLNLPL